MAQQYHNPFVRLGLIAPEAQRGYYDQYCRANIVGGTDEKSDQLPFRRRVDLWFVALALAAHKQLKPIDLMKEKTYQFVTGVVFNQDSWRIQIITLVAIAIEDNLEVVQDPRQMMNIANGLAAAGVRHIVEMLREGNQDPIWNLSDALDELLRSDNYGEPHKDNKDLSNVLNEVLRQSQ